MSDKFRFTGLPVPPQANHQRIPITMTIGGRKTARLVSGPELRKFQDEMAEWAKVNFLMVGKSRQVTNGWLIKGQMLRMDLFFFFPHSRIYTQNLDVRRFDVSNRVKAMEDGISEFIGIDDKHVFKVSAEKCETTKSEAYVNVLLTPWKPRGFQDVKEGEEL